MKTINHAPELEAAIIGIIIQQSDLLDQIEAIFFPEVFFIRKHQLIAKTILELRRKKGAVDLMTITNEMRQNGTLDKIGGAYELALLTNIVSDANLIYHAMIVFEMYMLREHERHALQVVQRVREGEDVLEIASETRKFLEQLEAPANKLHSQPINVQVDKTIKMMEQASGSAAVTFGISTGFKPLDQVLSGFVAGDTIVVAARPGMGKTSLMISLARKLMAAGVPTDIYSMESMYYNIIMRMMSQELNIPFDHVRTGKVDWLKVCEYAERISKSSLNIKDTTDMYGEDLESRIKSRSLEGVRVVMIDYLQLIKMRYMKKNANRENEVSEVTRLLKRVAMATGTTIIELSQLSRSVEQRGGDFRPRLADLRESGAIEQDADSVIFLYRPEYYKIYYDADGRSNSNLALLDVQKNRNGSCEEIVMRFINATTEFDLFPVDYVRKVEPKAIRKTRRKFDEVRDFTESVKDEEDYPF